MPGVAGGCVASLLSAFLFAPGVPAAATYVGTPANYLALLRKLQPGDTLTLAPGTYRGGLPLRGLHGAPGRPIVIRGSRDGATTLVARAKANTISIADSSYIEVRDLVLDGDGQFVDAVKAEGHSSWAAHITLDGLRIHRYGANQQIVGISTKCPAWGWVIRNNVIIGAGTGMYLGNSDGTAPFVAGIIERNVILDTVGYNLQIKHQGVRPSIDGMPASDSITIIRHNVFTKSENSATGPLARPNVLVGHFPPSGSGTEDLYAIYGNFFYQNPTEALFQGEGNIAFYSNVLLNLYGDAVNIQAHNAVPRRVDVFRNTILAATSGIRVSGADPDHKQRVFANAVFANAPIEGGEQQANKTGLLGEAAEYLADPFEPLGQLDLAPRPGKLNTVRFRLPTEPQLPDVNRDFDGRIYYVPVAGAYATKAARRLLIELKP